MFPEHWSVTLPHVAAVFHSAAESIFLRATALSTFSFIVPVTPDSWQACSHEERAQVRQAIAELSSFLPPLHGTPNLPTFSPERDHLPTSLFFTLRSSSRSFFLRFSFFIVFFCRCGVAARCGGECVGEQSGRQAQWL
jgi:hypothetical protein